MLWVDYNAHEIIHPSNNPPPPNIQGPVVIIEAQNCWAIQEIEPRAARCLIEESRCGLDRSTADLIWAFWLSLKPVNKAIHLANGQNTFEGFSLSVLPDLFATLMSTDVGAWHNDETGAGFLRFFQSNCSPQLKLCFFISDTRS